MWDFSINIGFITSKKMVLGLMDFLLGGKKKTKIPRTGQVAAPLNNVGGANNQGGAPAEQVGQVPNGQSVPTQNTNTQSQQTGGLEFVDSNNNSNNNTQSNLQQNQSQFNNGPKRSVSEVISKIHDELKDTNEKLTNLVTDVKSLENSVNTLGHRLDDLEESKKGSDEKIEEIDRSMTKFLSLYELINNQYNPFVESEKAPLKEITVENSGNSESNENIDIEALKAKVFAEGASSVSNLPLDLDASLLELDTLNIEEAAGDAVPLTNLKNNTNSLVVILSWLEYLIKKVGIEETRDSLRYYTETLRWITPEVFFDLDKYLRGMKDNANVSGDERLSVRDHIVSLYFISKLNEKVLDDKLTKAVLQIIKN